MHLLGKAILKAFVANLLAEREEFLAPELNELLSMLELGLSFLFAIGIVMIQRCIKTNIDHH